MPSFNLSALTKNPVVMIVVAVAVVLVVVWFVKRRR